MTKHPHIANQNYEAKERDREKKVQSARRWLKDQTGYLGVSFEDVPSKKEEGSQTGLPIDKVCAFCLLFDNTKKFTSRE